MRSYAFAFHVLGACLYTSFLITKTKTDVNTSMTNVSTKVFEGIKTIIVSTTDIMILNTVYIPLFTLTVVVNGWKR